MAELPDEPKKMDYEKFATVAIGIIIAGGFVASVLLGNKTASDLLGSAFIFVVGYFFGGQQIPQKIAGRIKDYNA